MTKGCQDRTCNRKYLQGLQIKSAVSLKLESLLMNLWSCSARNYEVISVQFKQDRSRLKGNSSFITEKSKQFHASTMTDGGITSQTKTFLQNFKFLPLRHPLKQLLVSLFLPDRGVKILFVSILEDSFSFKWTLKIIYVSFFSQQVTYYTFLRCSSIWTVFLFFDDSYNTLINDITKAWSFRTLVH